MIDKVGNKFCRNQIILTIVPDIHSIILGNNNWQSCAKSRCKLRIKTFNCLSTNNQFAKSCQCSTKQHWSQSQLQVGMIDDLTLFDLSHVKWIWAWRFVRLLVLRAFAGNNRAGPGKLPPPQFGINREKVKSVLIHINLWLICLYQIT